MSNEITLLGCGLRTKEQLTFEALAALDNAQQVFCLVQNSAFVNWIKAHHPNSVSLHALYYASASRQSNYDAIVNHVLDAFHYFDRVAFVLSGHPLLLCDPCAQLVQCCRQQQIQCRVLPGVSTVDNLVADLQIDPAPAGWQSYEASNFIAKQRNWNPTAHLILWQVGVIAQTQPVVGRSQHPQEIKQLTDYLMTKYSAEHPITLYEAALQTDGQMLKKTVPIQALAKEAFSPITTCYIPPITRVS